MWANLNRQTFVPQPSMIPNLKRQSAFFGARKSNLNRQGLPQVMNLKRQ
jgi:hypothetical protein